VGTGGWAVSLPRVSHLSSKRQIAFAVDRALDGIYAIVVSKSATYTEAATEGDKIVLFSGTGTVNLPSAKKNAAKLTFKLMTADTLTLDPAGTETIDGAATATLNVQYASLTLVSDGSNWVVI
jgi:hypothetical protein